MCVSYFFRVTLLYEYRMIGFAVLRFIFHTVVRIFTRTPTQSIVCRILNILTHSNYPVHRTALAEGCIADADSMSLVILMSNNQ